MKIGVLTYHRAENYGALLQAYAMKTYLHGMGHDASFVDYWPEYHYDYFRIFPKERFRSANLRTRLGLLRRFIAWYIPKYIRKARLQQFMKEKLGLGNHPKYTKAEDSTDEFDVVVYGSDQIWRKQHLGGVDFDKWYFGSDNVQADRKIVYAGSMGTINTTADDDEYVKAAMKNFEGISVREKDLQAYLEKMNISSTLVCDPVFLLDKEQWEEIKKKSNFKRKYILFYNLLNTPESKRFADSLSRRSGLPVIEVNKQMSLHHLGKRYLSTASVERFLGLIDGAEYVVSNSFHGVAFSIIFEKRFFAVGMGERANRVVSLLDTCGINNRYIGNDMLPQNYMDNIPYSDVSAKLSSLVGLSKEFLNQSIYK